VFDDRYEVIARYLTDNWRAFRTWGMSANSPWDYGGYWKQPGDHGRDRTDLALAVDWDHLQRPGPRAAYVDEAETARQLAFHASDYQPTAAAEALYRNNLPLLGYIAGKAQAFTSKDHNFRAGESIEKQLVVINNSRRTVSCEAEWRFHGASGRTTVSLPTGQQKRIAFRVTAPEAGHYEVEARFHFSTGEIQADVFAIDVVGAAAEERMESRMALFDPPGETARMLDGMKVRYQRIEANADLGGYDVLVIGKHALTLHDAAPGVGRVRAGLKVIVFEQTGEVLEQRLGFRIAEYGLRDVFRRVSDHPLLEGLTEANLHDWRGQATNLPARLTYEKPPLFNSVPTVKWAGLPVTRVWRNGNRGNVASALIEKPARGNFLAVLDGGYSLQYTPLAEYRDGKGMVLFCQLDVTGRSEPEPAAEIVVRNILRYVNHWMPEPMRTVVYDGSDEGRRYLDTAGVKFEEYQGQPVGEDRVLVAAAGGARKIAAPHVLALGVNEAQARAMAPVKTMSDEHISTYFEPFPFILHLPEFHRLRRTIVAQGHYRW
jgi:hypothetical protein